MFKLTYSDNLVAHESNFKNFEKLALEHHQVVFVWNESYFRSLWSKCFNMILLMTSYMSAHAFSLFKKFYFWIKIFFFETKIHLNSLTFLFTFTLYANPFRTSRFIQSNENRVWNSSNLYIEDKWQLKIKAVLDKWQ